MNERRRRCYIASPLGFNDAGRSYYYDHYLPALREVVEPVDPWIAVTPAEVAEADRAGRLRELWLRVGSGNLEAIGACDVLAAWLDGQEVDSGTAVEIGYAAGRGIRCYGLRSDLRLAGEKGMAVNLQVEATIVNTGGQVFRTLHDLVAALAEYSAPTCASA